MQRFAVLFIGLLVLIDAFFIAYAIGINVRKNTIVDPTLPISAPKIPAANPNRSTMAPPIASPVNPSTVSDTKKDSEEDDEPTPLKN